MFINQHIPGHYSAVIFDMDGVVIDSLAIIEYAWGTAAKKWGRVLSRDDYDNHIHGRTGRESLDSLFSDRTRDEKMKIWREVDALEARASFNEIPGASDFIKNLNLLAIPIGLATSSSTAKVTKALDDIGLSDCFDVLVTRDHIKNGKPDPEAYIKCAALLNTDPSDILVFEDSISGIQSAINAGATCIAIGTNDVSSLGVLAAFPDFRGLIS